MAAKKVIKPPNPFGEVDRDSGTRPSAVPVPAPVKPVTGYVVPGQTRDEQRRAYGHVLTDYGWVKDDG